MHLIRSPTLTLALIFSIISILLMILTVTLAIYDHSKNYLQLLVIFPPLNCIFLFLFSVTWIERRFRLSYIPFVCLIILMISCLTLTIISSSFFSLSIIFYFNFIYYCLFTIFFLCIIITTIVSYSYGSLFIHRYRNMMTTEQQNSVQSKTIEHLQIDKLIIKSTNHNELILYMSKLPGRRTRHDIRNIEDDLNQIQAHTIITLNEPKELSFMNMTNKNIFNMDIYSTHIKRANIQHILYPIRDRFIPKSISDYIQFIYSVIINANRSNRNHILVHCMGGMGRTGMTVVCLELVNEYIMKTDQKQNIVERFCHYPFLLTNSCRVCQAILNVRRARRGTIHNPLQIMFIHEFYARLTSPSYMQHIKKIVELNERLLSNEHGDLNIPL